MLRRVNWQFVADVSWQPLGLLFEGQAIQEECRRQAKSKPKPSQSQAKAKAKPKPSQSQAKAKPKPSQSQAKVLTGGGDLREAQVDDHLSVSHSRVWSRSWAQ